MDYILNRRSVRSFNDKKISDNDLVSLTRYAEAAPSARAQKGRAYIIINDMEQIKKLSEVSIGAGVLTRSNAKACIAVIGKDMNKISTPAMLPSDLAAATENILLKACEMGIGSCWIGIYPEHERMTRASEILNLGNNEFVFSLIALGYPSDDEAFFDAKKQIDVSFNRR